MVSFMDLFAGRFGDEYRAKRGVFWPGELWNSKARSCAVWIVARLGGWSGYQRYGPAGPKTIAYGWNQFKTMSQGWNLRQNV